MRNPVHWAGGLCPGDKVIYKGKTATISDFPIPWIKETPGKVPIIPKGCIASILVPFDDLSCQASPISPI